MKKKSLYFFFLIAFSLGWMHSVVASLVCTSDGFCTLNHPVVQNNSSGLEIEIIYPYIDSQKEQFIPMPMPEEFKFSYIYSEMDPYVPFPWPCEEEEDCTFRVVQEVWLPADSLDTDSFQNKIGSPYEDTPPYIPFPWPCQECDLFIKSLK